MKLADALAKTGEAVLWSKCQHLPLAIRATRTNEGAVTVEWSIGDVANCGSVVYASAERAAADLQSSQFLCALLESDPAQGWSPEHRE